MRKILQAIGLISGMIATSSCDQEVPYMAKYCGGYETAFYVMEDLSTLTIPQTPGGAAIDGPNVERGAITKADKGDFIEYTGDLDFIALKDVRSPIKIEGHPVEMREDHYIVGSVTSYGSRLRFFIDFDGALFRIDEIVSADSGKEISIRSEICGGKFIVN